jgi:hypothetical protein
MGHVEQAAELLVANDIHYSKFLIIGHPGEDIGEVLTYPDYSLAHGQELQGTTFFAMTPYPGTVLGQQYEEQGLVRSHDWDLYTNFCSVVELEGISPMRLQSLLCGVTAKYGMYRRYLKGKSFTSSLGRLFESLLVHARIGLMHADHTAEDVAAGLLEALQVVEDAKSRDDGRSGRKSAFDRFALRFHHDALDSVVVGTEARDGREVLVIRSGPEGLIGRGGHRKRELHLAARHLVALADSFDQRRLSTELLTLQWRPSAFKLRWLPALLRDLGAAGWVLARLLAFHSRCSLSGRPKRGLRTVEIPRPEPTATPTPSPAAASIQSSSRTRSSKALVN